MMVHIEVEIRDLENNYHFYHVLVALIIFQEFTIPNVDCEF